MKIIKVPATAPTVNGINGNIELKHISNLQNCEITIVRANKNKICHDLESAIVELKRFNSVPVIIKNVANGTDDKFHANKIL